jgi:prophage antirepressor-like protein
MFSIQVFPDTQTEVSSFVDDSQVIWFHAGHLGEVLEFTTASRYLPTVLESSEYREFKFNDSGRPALFVREEACYILIMRSKSTLADRFQRWLAYEVLPSIRKTGQYQATIDDQQHFEPFSLKVQFQDVQQNAVERLNRCLESNGSHEELNALAGVLDVVRKSLQELPQEKQKIKQTTIATAENQQILELINCKDFYTPNDKDALLVELGWKITKENKIKLSKIFSSSGKWISKVVKVDGISQRCQVRKL